MTPRTIDHVILIIVWTDNYPNTNTHCLLLYRFRLSLFSCMRPSNFLFCVVLFYDFLGFSTALSPTRRLNLFAPAILRVPVCILHASQLPRCSEVLRVSPPIPGDSALAHQPHFQAVRPINNVVSNTGRRFNSSFPNSCALPCWKMSFFINLVYHTDLVILLSNN